MLNLSTVPLKDLVKDYGPLFSAGATIVAATVASFAARAAMRSAHASELNVETSMTSMRLGNRAYISVIETKLTDMLQEGKTPHVHMTFKNVGKTPARRCVKRINFDFSDKPFSTELPVAVLHENQFSVAPDQQRGADVYMDDPLTTEQINEIKAGKLFIYFWGTIDYEDVFNTQHKTSWALVCDNDSLSEMSLHSCHNDMT